MDLTGPVERAIRSSIQAPLELETPTQGKGFVVDRITDRGIVLLLGEQQTSTPLSWECLEGIVEHLRGRGWMKIGSKYEVTADPDTLDAYLKRCTKRATAGWVAAVLERAGVIRINRSRPTSVRLEPGFSA
jgi:hypothetical protein